jgi:hypothetical protein
VRLDRGAPKLSKVVVVGMLPNGSVFAVLWMRGVLEVGKVQR